MIPVACCFFLLTRIFLFYGLVERNTQFLVEVATACLIAVEDFVGIFGHLHGHFPWDDNHGSAANLNFIGSKFMFYLCNLQFDSQ